MAENMNEEKILNIKIILLGETGTGKTNLISTFYGEKFNSNSNSTNVCQNNIKKLNINNNQCIINIWDTGGQEKFRSLTQHFMEKLPISLLNFCTLY